MPQSRTCPYRTRLDRARRPHAPPHPRPAVRTGPLLTPAVEQGPPINSDAKLALTTGELCVGCGSREQHHEHRTAGAAGHVDSAVVGLHHGGHDRQAEAGAAVRPGPGAVAAGEAFEDLRLEVGGMPGPSSVTLELDSFGRRRRAGW